MCFRIVVSVPDPVTGKARPRSSERFPLHTPIETLRSTRDALKREAARAWAPILEERQRQAREKLRAPRGRRTLRSRNIYKTKTGWCVEWSAPHPSTGIRDRHHQWFAGDHTIESLEHFRDARELEAKRAWTQIREARRRETRRRATERRRLISITLAPGIYKMVRPRDNVPVRFHVAVTVPDPAVAGKRRRTTRSFPLHTPREEMVRWRDTHKASNAAPAATLGDTLQYWRKQCGWTYDDAAREVGLTREAVRKQLKSLARPRVRHLRTWAERVSATLHIELSVSDLETDADCPDGWL